MHMGLPSSPQATRYQHHRWPSSMNVLRPPGVRGPRTFRIIILVFGICVLTLFFQQYAGPTSRIPQTIPSDWVAPDDEDIFHDRQPLLVEPPDQINATETHIETDILPNPESLPNSQSLPNPVPVRSTRHQRFLTLATMFKNQRRWLREWLEFYSMMGVEHFIIYDNNSTDLPLEILQGYIDRGQVTYIPWPPTEIPPPPENFATQLEEWQWSWFHDCLETCLEQTWDIHSQVPCQLAAWADAIRRTKGGISRWLGTIDVDEYIFPRPSSEYTSIAELLRSKYVNTDYIRVYGNTFGTNGHIHHAARVNSTSPLHALLTESYTQRAPYNHDDHPYADSTAEYTVHGKGMLGTNHFFGASSYIVKPLVDPDMISHCNVHYCNATRLNWNNWTEDWASWEDETWRFNHYAFLSQEDARQKSIQNKNPFIKEFSPEMDEFFSRVEDKEVYHYIPELKERIQQSIRENPPAHRDDWEP